jgi:hypothetical protein
LRLPVGAYRQSACLSALASFNWQQSRDDNFLSPIIRTAVPSLDLGGIAGAIAGGTSARLLAFCSGQRAGRDRYVVRWRREIIQQQDVIKGKWGLIID